MAATAGLAQWTHRRLQGCQIGAGGLLHLHRSLVQRLGLGVEVVHVLPDGGKRAALLEILARRALDPVEPLIDGAERREVAGGGGGHLGVIGLLFLGHRAEHADIETHELHVTLAQRLRPLGVEALGQRHRRKGGNNEAAGEKTERTCHNGTPKLPVIVRVTVA